MKINAEKQKNYAALPAAKCIPGTPPMLSALSASQFLRTPKGKKAEQTDDTPREFADETENEKPCGITKYLSDFAGFPVSYDGEATYFSSGKETFEAIMEAVRGAKKIHSCRILHHRAGKNVVGIFSRARKKGGRRGTGTPDFR